MVSDRSDEQVALAVGLLTGDDRVTIFRPDNCSITRIERQDGKLVVAEMGREVETEVL